MPSFNDRDPDAVSSYLNTTICHMSEEIQALFELAESSPVEERKNFSEDRITYRTNMVDEIGLKSPQAYDSIKVGDLSDAGAFLRPSLVSILAPLPICNVVVPRATALERISVIPATETEVSLLLNESWNTLEALFIGGVNISSAFLSPLTEYGKRLRYLEIRVDTNEESWHELLGELLRRLRLRGVGVFMSTKQNWTSTAQFKNKMKLDEQLVN
ncbi:hypothetical protein FRC02_002562 [Tulasnella sp. 418]|nr:hypothetical protein FRC02_002562 [Tulasnella sp. 418]